MQGDFVAKKIEDIRQRLKNHDCVEKVSKLEQYVASPVT